MENLKKLKHHVVHVPSTEAPDLGISAVTWNTTDDSILILLGPSEFDGTIELKSIATHSSEKKEVRFLLIYLARSILTKIHI
jgi:hypothetical protein